MVNNGFLIELDHSQLPNFASTPVRLVQEPELRPGNKHWVTWQTGFTGIAYNTKMIEREITSFNDLADPAFTGPRGHDERQRRTRQCGAVADGRRPGELHAADWAESTKWLEEAASLGGRLLRPELHLAPGERRHLDHSGVVRRHLPSEPVGLPAPQVRDAQGGPDRLARQHGDSATGAEPPERAGVDELLLHARRSPASSRTG